MRLVVGRFKVMVVGRLVVIQAEWCGHYDNIVMILPHACRLYWCIGKPVMALLMAEVGFNTG